MQRTCKAVLFPFTHHHHHHHHLSSSRSSFLCKRWYSTPQKTWNVLFFGTDEVSLATLTALRKAQSLVQDKLIDNLEVVVGGAAANQPIPVKKFAQKQGIKVHEVSRTSFSTWELPTVTSTDTGKKFDIGVVVSFGYFIPPRLISAFPYGGINMHPSLLPRHRGAAPLYYTLLCDDKVGGVSVIELHKSKFDAGRILYQQEVPIKPETTHNALLAELAELGAQGIVEVLQNFEDCSKNAKIQADENVTRAPKVNSTMGNINWSTQTAKEIWILWRALGDSVGISTHLPLEKTNARIKLVKLLSPDAHPLPSSLPVDAQSGFLAPCGDKLWVKCKDSWLAIATLQNEGKKVISASDWVNGYRIGKPSHPTCFVDVNI